MSNLTNDVEQETAYNQEVGYVFSRNMQVTVCAIGSTIFSYRIGQYVAQMIAPESYWINLISPTLFVGVAFLAIDWAFLNSLVGASSAAPEAYKKRLMNKAKLFFVCTLTMSIISNFFVSEEIKGESHLSAYNAKQEQREGERFKLKAKALDLIEKAKADQPAAISAAQKQGRALVLQAVKTGSSSHQMDYQKAKGNTKHWFWTCKRGKHCPQTYIDYRNRIIGAEAEAAALLAAASGAAMSTESNALAIATDTTGTAELHLVAANTLQLEAERKFKGQIITFGLGALALICGLLAMSTTSTLSDHRKIYGQKVPEDNVTSIMTILDFLKRIPDLALDILHNLTTRPIEGMKEKGWLLSYSFSAASSAKDKGAKVYTDVHNNTVTQYTNTADTSTDKQNEVKTVYGSAHRDIQEKQTQPKQDTQHTDTQHTHKAPHNKNKNCKNGNCKVVYHEKANGEIVGLKKSEVRNKLKTYEGRLDEAKKKGKASTIQNNQNWVQYWSKLLKEFN